jgi:hypothetical protein
MKLQDHTEGRLKNKEIAAYIAGFLDGDGSVRIQFQPRKDTLRVRAVVSFAQKWGKEKEMRWIRSQLGIGYLYQRNDHITELRIEGHETVERVLKKLQPHILLKKKQVATVLQILQILKKDNADLREIAKLADKISRLNYVTVKKKYTGKYIKRFLKSHTPVTTEDKTIENS